MIIMTRDHGETEMDGYSNAREQNKTIKIKIKTYQAIEMKKQARKK